MAGLRIESVAPDSIVDQFGVTGGDRLLAVNGHPVRDLIDYSYYTASEEELLLEVAVADGEIWELEIERSAGEPLGLIFAAPAPARCANNCLFCFVHQLPRGLRKPLYVKDEDYRLSFLNGNYVTLANIKNSELNRIIEQRLSPLYISVHATGREVRERLLGKQAIPDIMEQLKRLAAAGIALHTQVVLCPDINDGEELRRTVGELAALFPAVQSLAIVPLGLTDHRQNLPPLRPVDREYARGFTAQWQPEAVRLRKKLGQPFLFLADEFFLKGGEPFPPFREYGDFPQVENGVGMVPLFMKDGARALKRVKPVGTFRITVVTGVSSSGFVADFLAQVAEKSGLEIVLIPVENRLFGESITVSGLVTGRDIVGAVGEQVVGLYLLVPDVMLKEGEGLFLDDMSVDQLERQIGTPVRTFDSTPSGFCRMLRILSGEVKSGE